MPTMKFFAIAATLLFLPFTVHAEWTRFRGPNGTGVGEGKLPLKWSGTEHMAWKATLPGPGTSSPIIVGNKVFVTCWSGYGDGSSGGMEKLVRHLVCLDKAQGTILWDRTVPAAQPEDPFEGMLTEHGYASSTPVSDGEGVCVFFGKSGAVGFDMNGKQLWQTSLGTHSNDRRWGSAASPMLYKELLVVNALDEGGAIVALNKRTGKEAWRAPAEGLSLAYSTPAMVEHDGLQDLVIAVPQELWGLNPDTGKLRWFADHDLTGNVSPGVVLGDGKAFVFGGYPKQGSAAIKFGGRNDVTKTNLVWQSNTSTYVPTPIYFEGHLYVINDQGFALCIDAATGKEVYRERVMEGAGGGRPGGPGSGGGQQRRGGGKPFYASPVLVDGKLYCPSRKNGTFVIAAKPKYELLARNIIEGDKAQFNATPAVDGNRLYLRSERTLYCIGE
ncbi:MAG: Pyrrolo-quinoline quinone [Verrucomicrobiaceae bacterium]|nr:Pyrrolo-quinoline quinone [Verrucomicrobiaceae bacterium]